MIRNLSWIFALSLTLTACGGSSGGSKSSSSSSTPATTSSSSVVSSSSVASSEASSVTSSQTPSSAPSSTSSSEAQSSSSVSSCEAPASITLDLSDFEPNYGHDVIVTQSTDGALLSFSVSSSGNQAAIIKLADTPINRATIEMTVNIDEAFILNQGTLQVFAQSRVDYSKQDFKGPDASTLTANTDIVLTNALGDIAAFDTDALQIGLQAKGALAAGIITVKSVVIHPFNTCNANNEGSSSSAVSSSANSSQDSSSSQAASSVPASSAPSSVASAIASWDFASSAPYWGANNGSGDSTEVTVVYDSASAGLKITPKNWDGATYLYSAVHYFGTPLNNAVGKTITVVLSAPQSLVTDNMQFQIFAKSSLAAQYGADYSSYFSLTNPIDGKYIFTYTILDPVGTKLDAIGIQPANKPSNTSNLDGWTIHSVTIQ